MSPRLLRCVLLLFFLFVGAVAAQAKEPAFPALTGRVVDEAQLLKESDKAELVQKLSDLEAKTGRQLVVATIRSLQGLEIEDYGYQLGRHWGIGQKGTNNGALLIVAPNEHQVRIEVGYGLEGTLTDAVSRLIIENAILPRFRVNDFAGGIKRGVDDLIQVLSGDAEEFQRRAVARDRGATSSNDYLGLIWFAVILGFWLFFMLRSQRRGYRRSGMPWIIPIGGSGWPGGGWDGGFGGGSSGGGGFSGGGGSFGGGGASGRW